MKLDEPGIALDAVNRVVLEVARQPYFQLRPPLARQKLGAQNPVFQRRPVLQRNA